MRRQTLLALAVGLLIGGGVVYAVRTRTDDGVSGDFDRASRNIGGSMPAANTLDVARQAQAESERVWAISFVRARPGQRERLERHLAANWLTLDAKALARGQIAGYRMLRADVDRSNETDRAEAWDFAVIIEYADRAAMAAFVPAYLALLAEHPQVRIDGLDFADLGTVVQQKVVMPLANDVEALAIAKDSRGAAIGEDAGSDPGSKPGGDAMTDAKQP